MDVEAKLTDLKRLRTYTEMHFDVQQTRVRVENIAFSEYGTKDEQEKIRKLAKDTEWFETQLAQGVVVLEGVVLGDDLAELFSHVAAAREAEANLERVICQKYRQFAPPGVIAWQQQAHGVGELLMARLLGAIGHPRWCRQHYYVGTGKARKLHDDGVRPRTVNELWAYCGHGDPTRRRTKGMDLFELFEAGNPRAKMLTHLMAEFAVRCRYREGDPPPFYRAIYNDAKRKYATRIHAADCAPCHAKEGDPWAPGHQHAAALRYLGKRMLRDLWAAAK